MIIVNINNQTIGVKDTEAAINAAKEEFGEWFEVETTPAQLAAELGRTGSARIAARDKTWAGYGRPYAYAMAFAGKSQVPPRGPEVPQVGF